MYNKFLVGTLRKNSFSILRELRALSSILKQTLEIYAENI